MRIRRRYRPGHDFRPAAELLVPRIAPSDIAVIMYLGTDPSTGTGDPGTGPECPVYTGPDDGGDPDGVTPSPQASTQDTSTVGS
jgi:hypothetical protein